MSNKNKTGLVSSFFGKHHLIEKLEENPNDPLCDQSNPQSSYFKYNEAATGSLLAKTVPTTTIHSKTKSAIVSHQFLDFKAE